MISILINKSLKHPNKKQPFSLERQSILHLNIFNFYLLWYYAFPTSKKVTWDYHSMEFSILRHKTYIII